MIGFFENNAIFKMKLVVILYLEVVVRNTCLLAVGGGVFADETAFWWPAGVCPGVEQPSGGRRECVREWNSLLVAARGVWRNETAFWRSREVIVTGQRGGGVEKTSL